MRLANLKSSKVNDGRNGHNILGRVRRTIRVWIAVRIEMRMVTIINAIKLYIYVHDETTIESHMMMATHWQEEGSGEQAWEAL